MLGGGMKKIIVCVVCGLICFCNAADKKAIIIGATSGMGKALAIKLAKEGYIVGMAGRRKALLADLKKQIPNSYIKRIDVTIRRKLKKNLNRSIEQMGGTGLMVISVSSHNDLNNSMTQAETKKLRLMLICEVFHDGQRRFRVF